MEWEDFAQYVTDYGDDYNQYLDGHFHPISATCDPCVLPFNFIVKLTTFSEGINYFINVQLVTSQAKYCNFINGIIRALEEVSNNP